MKKLLTRALVLAALLAPGIAFAAYNDVTLNTTDAVFSVGGVTLTVTGSNAEIASAVVTATDITLTMEAGSSLAVSGGGKQINLSTNPALPVTTTCSGGSSSVAIPASGAATVVITPTNTACTDPSAGTSSGGGGGGGGSVVGLITTSVPATIIPKSLSSTSTPASASATPGVPSAQASAKAFAALAKNLARKMNSAQIKVLQQMLNSDADTQVSLSGAGSPGKETTLFGIATEAAVKKFQTKYGIVSSGTAATTGFGAVGPKTRAKLNELYAK